jgi:hypothetical protein
MSLRGDVAAAGDATAVASVSMTAMTSWPATVAPSACRISTSHACLRCRQLEHHLVGLDVDEVFIARHRFATFLCQLTRVASATDSGNCGTLTSTRIKFLCLSSASRRAFHPS